MELEEIGEPELENYWIDESSADDGESVWVDAYEL
jgi:hypothetical protein